jgi:hypothetical protein
MEVFTGNRIPILYQFRCRIDAPQPDSAPDDLGERHHWDECSNRVAVASRALSTEGAARRDQQRRSEVERSDQKPAGHAVIVRVHDEFVGRERVRKRHVAEQIALTEELDAIAFVVVGVGRPFRSRGHRSASLSGEPGRFSSVLLVGVAEDESTAVFAPGVHDGALGGWRELLEHLSAHPLDVLRREPPEAATG